MLVVAGCQIRIEQSSAISPEAVPTKDSLPSGSGGALDDITPAPPENTRPGTAAAGSDSVVAGKVTGTPQSIHPGSPGSHGNQVEICNVYCFYAGPSRFPFGFTLKNPGSYDIEVSYTWTLNHPEADWPQYEGQGKALLPAMGQKDIEIIVAAFNQFDPQSYLVHIHVYQGGKEIGFYN